MSEHSEEFITFMRQNPHLKAVGKGDNAEINFPMFRNYDYIPARNADDDGGAGGDPITTSTRSPSPELSLAPSEFPTAVAAVLTKVPSAGPSILESPSKAPTLLPTIGNIDTDNNSKASIAPTAGPSILESPSKAPTLLPTIGNIDTDNKPSIDCRINADGEVNADANADQDFVNFNYKIVTQKGVANLLEEVLPLLEKELLKMILPDIFQCDADQRALTATNYHSSRRLALLGASVNPLDIVSLQDTCVAANEEENECSMIDGSMTFFFSGDDVDLSAIEKFTCDALNSETLAMVHPAIVGLECITYGSDTGIGGSESNNGTPPVIAPAVSQRLSTSVLVASALAAVMVVFGVYAYRRRQNKEEDVPALKANLDDSDDVYNVSNSLSFEDLPMAWSTQAKVGAPAFDMRSIIPKGYSPETIEEHPEEDALDEVSLDQLNMNIDDSDLD